MATCAAVAGGTSAAVWLCLEPFTFLDTVFLLLSNQVVRRVKLLAVVKCVGFSEHLFLSLQRTPRPKAMDPEQDHGLFVGGVSLSFGWAPGILGSPGVNVQRAGAKRRLVRSRHKRLRKGRRAPGSSAAAGRRSVCTARGRRGDVQRQHQRHMASDLNLLARGTIETWLLPCCWETFFTFSLIVV